MPVRVKETLIGKGGVQGLDGRAHAHRKAFLMSLVNETQEERLIKIAIKQWDKAINRWQSKKQIILFEEAKKILCRVACDWAGIPLEEKEVKEVSERLNQMIFGFGRIGKMHWEGRVSRNKLEAWLETIIEAVRDNRLEVDHETILYQISHYRDETGKLLTSKIAAVEILNLIRPIVAIAVYITFAAVALYENPAYKARLALDDRGEEKNRFNKEVRRYYPFAPFIGAKVKKNFIWRDYAFKKGTLVLLDLYGTNHDERLWKAPYTFNPDRYKDRQEDLYHFMPQGGGSIKGHRCMGEGITMAMMNVALEVLIHKISYKLPKQDLSYSVSCIPTIPESGFVMEHIKRLY